MFGRKRPKTNPAASPSLEIHVAISPTPTFANMVHYLVHSLRTYGGRYRDAKVVITVGDPKIDRRWERENKWLSANSVEVRWLSEDLYEKQQYYATAVERFRYEFDSEMVLMLDADVLIHRPFEDLVLDSYRNQAFYGLIAHVTPLSGEATWETIYDSAGLGKPELRHEHTGWGYMFSDSAKRYCPPYFNLGVLCGPAAHMNAIGSRVYEYMAAVDKVYTTIFKCQLAAGMAVDALGIRYKELPMRFNFANDSNLEALYGEEMIRASILHILRDHQGVAKNRLYSSLDEVKALVGRDDLRNINEMVRRTMETIHPMVLADRA
jgi:hypothetical protein